MSLNFRVENGVSWPEKRAKTKTVNENSRFFLMLMGLYFFYPSAKLYKV